MHNFLFSPPVLFLILLFAFWGIYRLLAPFSFKARNKQASGTGKAYACGENDYDPMSQPDYSNFFPFAFFFTLAHVAALILATLPAGSLDTSVLAGIYIFGTVIGLYILLRD